MRFKHLMSFWVFVLIIMVITLISIPTILLGAENNNQISNDQTNEESELLLAEIYAKHFGVTVDEALKRLRLQNVAGELDAELSSKEADTLAGIWIEHTPEFKVIVLFTRDPEDVIRPYLQEYKELANIIEVGTAKISLVELQNIQEEISSSAESIGIPTASEINVYKNCVLVYVVDRAQFDKSVSEGKLALPDCVDVIAVESLVYLETEIYGGLPLRTSTSGFAVKNSSGTKGITTAGHCSNSQSYGGVNLPFQSENYGTYYDIQWHTAPGFTVTNKIKSSSSGTTNITATLPRLQQIIGSSVAKYGRSTGFTSGFISSKTFKPGSAFQATFIRVNNSGYYYNLSEEGDSGCPWFIGNTAWGSHCGAPGDDPNDAYYMAIDYMNGIGVSVMLSPQ